MWDSWDIQEGGDPRQLKKSTFSKCAPRAGPGPCGAHFQMLISRKGLEGGDPPSA